MKVHIEIECSAEEARQFMGLPDVERANAMYVEQMAAAMKGAGSTEQLDQFARQLAPMGQLGLKMFQSFVEGAARQAQAGGSAGEGASAGKGREGASAKD